MTIKYILAVALLAPLLTVSSMAQDATSTIKHVYQGGPKSPVLHTTRQINSGSDIYAMGQRAKTPRANRVAPRSN